MDRMRNKLMYVGAGGGLVMFAVFGMLPGSFLGGVMGLSLVNGLTGTAASGILSRIIVAVSMLTGVLASGLVFTVAGATIGWLVGLVVDGVRKPVEKTDEQTHNI